MPITFDTIEEFIAFYNTFSLDKSAVGKRVTGAKRGPKAATAKTTTGRKPGRPPGKKSAVAASKPAAKKVTAAAVKKAAAAPKKAAGRKPAAAVKGAKKVTAPKMPAAVVKKAGTARSGGKVTLTSHIQNTIRKFLNDKRSFTANDVYDELSKREKDVNKQSVITSVLKQMNSTFSSVSVTERAGAGPRPVKLYNAKAS